MPPAGVKKGSKHARKYEHVKDSVKDRGGVRERAEEIGRAPSTGIRPGREDATASEAPHAIRSPPASAAARAPHQQEEGAHEGQLYDEAKQLGIDGRSSMKKGELRKAVDAKE